MTGFSSTLSTSEAGRCSSISRSSPRRFLRLSRGAARTDKLCDLPLKDGNAEPFRGPAQCVGWDLLLCCTLHRFRDCLRSLLRENEPRLAVLDGIEGTTSRERNRGPS